MEAPEEPVDDFLVRRAQEGYLDAFTELVDRHSTRVYRTAYRLLGNHHDAEDVTQDVFVSAWQSLPAYRREARFSTWLYRITMNRAITAVRRDQRRGQPIPFERLDSELDVAPGPAQQHLVAASHDAIRSAVARLPMDQRLPLVLRQFESLSYAEIADITGKSVPTVRSQLHRARRTLAGQLEAWR